MKIVTCDRTFFSGMCKTLVIPAEDGEIAVQAHHENMIITSVVGAIRFRRFDDVWVTGVVTQGIVQVANNRVTMLVFAAEFPEEIDIHRAEQARIRAEEELRQKQSIQEYYASTAALARATARIREFNKKKPTGY